MEKVFEVIKRDEQYFLEEVDISDMGFENDEELEDYISLQLDYCLECLPFQYVLIYQTENGTKDTSYYFNEEHLKDMWEEEVVDELLENGVFDDGGIRFELYRIGNQPNNN